MNEQTKYNQLRLYIRKTIESMNGLRVSDVEGLISDTIEVLLRSGYIKNLEITDKGKSKLKTIIRTVYRTKYKNSRFEVEWPE